MLIMPLSSAFDFYDDFDRADNNTIGNGWSENEGGDPARIQIFDKAVDFNAIADISIGRDLNVTQPVNVSANFTEISNTGSGRNFWVGVGVNSISTIIDQGYYLEYSFDDDTVKLWENNTQRASYPYVVNTGEIQYFDFHVHFPDIYAFIWNDSVSKPASPNVQGVITWNSTYELVSVYADRGVSNAVYYLDNFNVTVAEVRDLQKGITVFANNTNTGTSLADFNVSLYNSSGSLLRYNFTNTTTGFVWLGENLDNYTITFDKTGFLANNYTFEYLNATQGHTFLATEVPTLNLTFYDEQTNELLTKNVTFSVLFGDGTAFNGSTSTGFSSNVSVATGIVEITYDSELYHERKYFVNMSPLNVSALRLYLLNKTAENVAQIDYRVTDENFKILPDAYVKVMRRYIESGAEVTRVVEISKSDINGEGFVHVEKVTADYQFIIEYLGNVVLITEISPIKDATTNLRVSVDEDVVESLFDKTDITTNLTFNNVTRKFTFIYNDPNNIVEEICLRISRILGSGSRLVNSSCLSTATGTITLGIPVDTGNYVAYAYIDTNTEFSEHPLEQLSIIDTTEGNLQSFGLFGALLIALGLTFGGLVVSRGNPTVTLTMFGVGIVVVSAFLNLAIFTYTTIAVMLFLIIFVIGILRRRGE